MVLIFLFFFLKIDIIHIDNQIQMLSATEDADLLSISSYQHTRSRSAPLQGCLSAPAAALGRRPPPGSAWRWAGTSG